MDNQLLTALVGPICLLLGVFIALWVKDKAREVARTEFSESIKLALSTFREELVAKLDLTYGRAPELKLMFENRDERFGKIEDRLDVHGQAITDLESESRHNADLQRRVTNIEQDIQRIKDHGKT